MNLYRCTLKKYSKKSKRYIYSDIEDFSEDRLLKTIKDLEYAGWDITVNSWRVYIASENQIKSGKYLGLI